MAQKSNSRLIGAFVVGAVALLVVGVLVFGGGRYLKTKIKSVLYFEGSLAGLDIGSPLTFRGVKIGTVTGIVIQYDVEHQRLRIPVYAEIEEDRIDVVSGTRTTHNINELIDRGLRAQLQVQSLVTGQVSVNLDFHPEAPARLVGTEPGIAELPTIPSDVDVLKSNLASVLNKFSGLPLDQISSGVVDVLRSSDQALKDSHQLLTNLDIQVKPLSDSAIRAFDQADRAFADVQALIKDADIDLPKLVPAVLQVMHRIGESLDQVDATLRGAQGVVAPSSRLNLEVSQTLQEIRTTATAIRVLAEFIQRNPNALLVGKR
jgi:paraquat-inducible protein B